MLFLTRQFGITENDAERNLDQETALFDEIVEYVLLLQANSANQQKRPICRGTHAKVHVCADNSKCLILVPSVGPNWRVGLPKEYFQNLASIPRSSGLATQIPR